MPVLLFYNLFAIEAKQITYDPKSAVLEATGDVLAADGSDKDRHFAAVRFKFKEGKAVRDE